MNKPRLLVIGGTGFIGSHLLAATKDDWQVTSVSLNPPSPQRFVSSVRYLKLDLTNYSAVNEVLSENYDYVVNLGGYVDHTLFQDGGHALINTHFLALKNLISVLSRKSLKRFVHIGSSDEYGNLPAPQNENLREQPISPYSLAKVACTHLLQMLYRTEEFPAVVLRVFLTYGPNQDGKRFLPQIIKACLSGDEFPTSAGYQHRDFCYVEDVVSAILLSLNSNKVEGQVINIASGIPVSIREIIDITRDLIGSGHPQYGKIPYRPSENMYLYASIEKAKNILCWTPEVNLQEGLIRTIESQKNIQC